MLLAIDIGNTNVVYGVFDGPTLRSKFRIATPVRITHDEAGLAIALFMERAGIDLATIDTAVVASVVPSLTAVYERTIRKYFDREPITVSHLLKLPVTIDIDSPEEIGADRIANTVAGHARYGGPLIVVDFGTATTFDVISADSAYIGGVIIAGPETSMAELSRRAAKLFQVQIRKPERVIGRSTAGALRSGAFYGLIGQVDTIIEQILTESGFVDCTIIATGGLAYDMEKHSRYITAVEPELTLDGLRLIGEGTCA